MTPDRQGLVYPLDETPETGSVIDIAPGVRWLHPAMLTTLVYRYGAPGTAPAPGREMANGQCTAFERVGFLDAGGMTAVQRRGRPSGPKVSRVTARVRLTWISSASPAPAGSSPSTSISGSSATVSVSGRPRKRL